MGVMSCTETNGFAAMYLHLFEPPNRGSMLTTISYASRKTSFAKSLAFREDGADIGF